MKIQNPKSKIQNYNAKLKTIVEKKRLLVFGGMAVFLLSLFIFNGSNDIAVTQKDNAVQNTAGGRGYSGTNGNAVGGDVFTDGLDQAGQIFLDGKPKSKEETKAIIRYFNQANSAIPLTSDALRFALAELILGNYEPLNDAVLRLQEGALAMKEITPLQEIYVFHNMSIKLLEEYERILNIPLKIPREEFEPQKMGDDFRKLEFLMGLARRELKLLQDAHGVSLFPKSILFYDEAIGTK